MNIPFNDLRHLHDPISNDLSAAIARVMKKSWFILGDELAAFESEFAGYLGVKHCIGTNSCTDAMEIVMRIWGVGPGDEVMMQANTWISILSVTKMLGATPVFVDCQHNSHYIDLDDLKKKLSDRTRMVCVTHLYGFPERMDEIKKILDDQNIKLMEDGAHAHGATYREGKIGSLADAGVFSFYPTKNLGALGDGGCITTDDDQLAEESRYWRNHGQQKRDDHVHIGRNSRLDELQAAVLRVKLKYLDNWNAERRKLAKMYYDQLPADFIEHNYNEEATYHLFPIMVENRKGLIQKFRQAGIGWGIHYPNTLTKLIGTFVMKHAGNRSGKHLSIPLYPGLSKAHQHNIIKILKQYKQVY